MWIYCNVSSDAFSQKISVEMYNKTGLTLDSVQLENIYLGCILNDSSVTVHNLKEVQLSGSRPQLRISAIDISGAPLKNLATCGTKASGLKEGHYKFDIMLNTSGLIPHLVLVVRM